MADTQPTPSERFTWTFQRMGGQDQVMLRTADELRHLGELDPKLWVILSCPASGLEFDARTLALVDTDHDDRIRIPEVAAAVQWACDRLADPASMAEPGDAMPLSAIDTSTENGRRLVATARSILKKRGKAETDPLTQADVEDAVANAARNTFNGDGVFPPLDELDDDVSQYIADALGVVGGVQDASGKPGVNRALSDAFLQALSDWRAWRHAVDDAPQPLGADTAAAWELLQHLKGKIDDYFLRTQFAAYAPESSSALNVEDKLKAPADNSLLEPATLTGLPLAHIAPDKPLTVTDGLNPAWSDDTRRFFEMVKPLLPTPGTLSREDWKNLQDRFAPYAAALAQKPVVVPGPDVTTPPDATIDELGTARVDALLNGDTARTFEQLAARDVVAPTASDDIAEAEKLVLFYLHLYRLLMNFVSFYDFYSLRRHAMFQAGTLFLDGRSCQLCLPVADVAKHSVLAVFSRLCLVYCRCARRQGPDDAEPAGTMIMVAAMTAGDASLLIEGRNGVFVDNLGNDWDATVIKVVQNPISLRQAVWAPYKRFGRMVTEQLEKFASAKTNDLAATAGKKLETLGSSLTTGKTFDIGKSVGIFAAVGLALGAIGTALASLSRALFALHWWQFPLIILGAFLLISGPSVFVAWLKLRNRTLGPMLEASGWAVNSWLPINLMLGKALTSVAELPDNSTRSFRDPLRKPARWRWLALAVTLVVTMAAGWWLFTREVEPDVETAARVAAEEAQKVLTDIERAREDKGERAEAAGADAPAQ